MAKKPAHERFFDTERPAAVLKHEILKQYVPVFASKTGPASTGGRVVYVDGYAGRGRSKDGVDGSPALIIDSTQTVAAFRKLECHFVEKDRDNHTALRVLLTDEADGLTWETYHGTVEEHLDDLLEKAEGLPLFMFLDPFGFGLPFDDVVNKIYARPWFQYSPGTEVLLNFSVSFDFTPPLVSTLYDESPPEDLAFMDISLIKHGLPSLPPGKTFRLLFEDARQLYQRSDLPRRYDVRVSFKDARRRDREALTYHLDADVFFGWHFVHEKGLHNIADSLERVQKTLDSWTTSLDGMKVYNIDYDTYQQRLREDRERRLATRARDVDGGSET